MAYEIMDRKIARKTTARRAFILLSAACLLLLAGCREDMHNQPKFIPLRENDFYADGRSARPAPEGTIARGQLEDDPLLYTGKVNGQEANQFPFAISSGDLARGRERFNIYCAPCHSELGEGNGMVAQRGFKNPPSYYEPRLMTAPVGHFFNVMTNGWGAMGDYSAQVPVADRWRIAAYIRALQLSRTAKSSDVPAGQTLAKQAPGQSGDEVKMAQGAVVHSSQTSAQTTEAK
jgi:mono/diheme cytochrome c family protein